MRNGIYIHLMSEDSIDSVVADGCLLIRMLDKEHMASVGTLFIPLERAKEFIGTIEGAFKVAADMERAVIA